MGAPSNTKHYLDREEQEIKTSVCGVSDDEGAFVVKDLEKVTCKRCLNVVASWERKAQKNGK